MSTKTYQNAKNFSNSSKFIEYENREKGIILGGSIMGSLDIDDLYQYKVDENVEDTLEDLTSIAIGSVGDVVTRTANISPAGYSQIDQWEFKAGDDFVYDKPTVINILGVGVEMKVGYTLDNVVLETVGIIEKYIADGLYFSEVKVISNKVIEVEYNDRRHHNPSISNDEPRMTVEKTVKRQMVAGYGQWNYLGMEKKTFGEVEKYFYFFERIG